jgi:hypothetical protein
LIRSRLCSVLLAAVLAAPSLAHAQGAPAPAASLAEADKAAHAKDWSTALTKYQAALQGAPSAGAQLGVADALFQLGRAADAYDAYAEAQRTYGAKLGKAEKALVEARLKELAKKTGALLVRANEPGAKVEVDGKAIGVSPLAGPVRIATGTHDVHVSKAGFSPFAAQSEIAPDATAVVEVTLVAQPTKGHVVVHANSAEPLRVLVDGVDVGPTPWEGDLLQGAHQIAGRSSTAAAPAQTVDVAAGGRTAIDLAATTTAAQVQVRTSDGKGVIYVDGVVKAEGAFSGVVPAGTHTLVITREDYKRYEKTLTLQEQQVWAETVTLEPDIAAAGLAQKSGERPFEGLYGGFGLVGLFGVGGMGTELETSCDTLGAASCNTPSPNGGGVFGYAGWTWNPVGFELFAAFSADVAKQSAHFNASLGTAGNPLATPGRDEDFTFGRSGGMVAARVRASTQWEKVRLTVAGGVGLAVKEMGVQRIATATDGSNGTDTFTAGGVVYYGAALTAEAAVHYRVTPTIAISLGLEMLADNASEGGSTAVGPQPGHYLISKTEPPAPIPTPQYYLASGPQVFLGPFLGMIFGP